MSRNFKEDAARIRIIKRAIVKAAKEAGITQSDIDLALGAAPRVKSKRPQVTPADRKTLYPIVAQFVIKAKSYGWLLTVEDLQAPGQKMAHAAPRMVAMWLCRVVLGGRASFPVIGQFFGGRHHTTAMHAINEGATAAMKREPGLASAAEDVRKYFGGTV